MKGQLRLRVSAEDNGRSFLSGAHCAFPVKIMRPFYLDAAGTAFVYAVDAAGGLLGGDTIDYEIRVDDGARLYFTNASTAKAHPMPRDSAVVRTKLSVGEKAGLEYFPEASMLFRETTMTAVTRIEAAESSVFACWDIVASGRKHSGEQFQFRKFENELAIRIGGRLVLWETYRLEGDTLRGGTPGILDEYTHWGSLYVYGQGDPSLLLESARDGLEAAHREGVFGGCSLHPSGVLIVKALGNTCEDIKSCFHAAWARLRPILLQEELPDVRK